MTQTNLGLALATLGERESGIKRLEEAVDADRAALQEDTRERVPLQWAMTQTNLGLALTRLGERTHDSGQLEEARKAISAAFDAFMQAGQQQYRRAFEDQLHEIDRQISALKTAR
jgi:tetratricopeptide (TPR) repeat protein